MYIFGYLHVYMAYMTWLMTHLRCTSTRDSLESKPAKLVAAVVRHP